MEGKHNLIYIISGVILIGLIIFLLFRNNPSYHEPGPSASISGQINFNGIKPGPDSPQKGNIEIKAKSTTDVDFQTVQTIPLEDNAQWSWSGAQSGQNYQIMATVNFLNQKIKDSTPSQVTAPATNVPILLNVTVDDIPEDIIQSETGPLSGTLEIHGYTTSQTSVFIQAREAGQSEWNTVQENLSATTGTAWNWDLARTGFNYEVRGQILSSDGVTILGTSTVQNMVAPASSEVIKITSNATPPQPTTATISGKIYINGPIAPNSTVLVLQRPQGASDYQEVTRLAAVSGTSWSWTDARQGQHYDIKAAYQVNGNNQATSSPVQTAAPSNNVHLTINTGIDLPKPPTPEWEACGPLNNNTFNTILKMKGDDRATHYWVQVGTQPRTSDVLNNKFANQGNTWQQVNVNVPQNTRVHAQYSYCLGNCDQNSSFSEPSDIAQKVCPEGSATQFTGYICNTDSKVCQGTTDPNAPFAYNNDGLKQCQLNCN